MTGNIGNWLSRRFGNCVGILWFVAVMLCASSVYAQDEIPDIVIDERTGVKIVFYDFTKHEPKSKHLWGRKEIGMEVVPAKPEMRRPYRDGIQDALKQYPVELIKKHLRTIYMIEKIYLTYESGETYSHVADLHNIWQGSLYLMARNIAEIEPRYSLDRFIPDSFHEGFSKFLWYEYPHMFPKKEWLALFSSDFQYGHPGDDNMVVSENPESHDDRCLAIHYIRTWKSDVSNIARLLFKLRAIGGRVPDTMPIDKFPCVRKKVDLMATFYRRIHPMFTAEYFANEN